MCFMPKPEKPIPPAAAPAAPAPSASSQEIGAGRENENKTNYGSTKGPKLRRPATPGRSTVPNVGITPPRGGSGVRM